MNQKEEKQEKKGEAHLALSIAHRHSNYHVD